MQSNSHFRFRPVVALPTYNNARTLPEILDKTDRLKLPLIVVNDGATDETADILSAWQQTVSTAYNRVIHHPRNRGKAAALETGFTAAIAAGYTHAATIDTDGQLDPTELPKLLATARRHPGAFILGTRDAHRPDYPVSSRVGRVLSNFMIRLECGQRVEDSQCGFRVYPLAMIRMLSVKAHRFGYETEIITRAAWAGFPLHEMPVSCRYFPGETRISHFNPWLDTLRSIGMHARLLLLSRTRRSCACVQKYGV